ncbi:MAG: hypothetical protein N2111_14680, partial [Candidatus Sumerlaeaceae bacterium]|nr:hypothetical protein [Candidatus Sumerlaeaceae bacterium]
PPLVVAYAIAGRIDLDLERKPLGLDPAGQPVYLKDLWPSPEEIAETIASCVTPEAFKSAYAEVFRGDARWQSLAAPGGLFYDWPESTYIRRPPYFEGMALEPDPITE